VQNPWSGYPGYTSVQLQNFNRAGEDALLLRAATTFGNVVQGMNGYVLWVHGFQPASAAQPSQDEYDANLQWAALTGALQGLALRLRYGYVARDNGTRQNEYRIMLTYGPEN
jgi:outer membrane OprD family porin